MGHLWDDLGIQQFWGDDLRILGDDLKVLERPET